MQVKENAHTLSNLYYYDSTLHGYPVMDEQENWRPEFEAYMERLTSQYQILFMSGRQFQDPGPGTWRGYCMVHTRSNGLQFT